MIMKSNIWKIFYVMFIGAFILVSSLLYNNYINLNKRYHVQTHHYTEIIAKTVNSSFLHNEMILDVVGRQLLENDFYKNENQSKHILDEIIKQNSYLIAFGLADVNGNILISSSNVKNISKKNLLRDKHTRTDFKKSLLTDKMIIGRTYFFKNVNSWIIPLRKLIKDKNGNILGVVIAGLKNSKNSNYLDDLEFSKDKAVVIIQDNKSENSYRLYSSNYDNHSFESLYNLPVPKLVYTNVVKSINKYIRLAFLLVNH